MIKEPSEEMIIELVNSFEHRNILTALEVELSLDLMKESRERKRLKKIINDIYKIFEEGHFEDGCDCIKIYDYLQKIKGENNGEE